MNKFNLLLVGLLLAVGLILAGCGTTDKVESEEQESTGSAKQKDPSERFYFTANESGSISKINVADNKVVATIQADGTVHNVQVSDDGNILGATLVPHSSGEDGEGHEGHGKNNGSALFYDTKTNKLIKKVVVGSHPAHIVFTENGKFALVTNNEDNTVSIIEMESYSVVTSIPTGKGPHGFRISKDGKWAYVANMAEDTISVINLDSLKEEKQIKVGMTPVTTGVTSDGKEMVTTLNGENNLAIVDLETNKVEKVEVGTWPAQVYIDFHDEFAYVVNQGTKESPSNTMSIIALEESKVLSTIETGKGAHGVVISKDNQFAYVTNMFEDTVSVVDLTERAMLSLSPATPAR
ncbi:YncE family protein [Mesobacillus foraminis]|uniref:YncE family protein n=1 Tax=Mesobacillus foraminis TaxID=279826 RepID=UPI001BEA127E|nr:YncE family protein [Mesobacillus foraminis]MBT2758800.1 YncE family protein [Mesobacillus foraminis]